MVAIYEESAGGIKVELIWDKMKGMLNYVVFFTIRPTIYPKGKVYPTSSISKTFALYPHLLLLYSFFTPRNTHHIIQPTNHSLYCMIAFFPPFSYLLCKLGCCSVFNLWKCCCSPFLNFIYNAISSFYLFFAGGNKAVMVISSSLKCCLLVEPTTQLLTRGRKGRKHYFLIFWLTSRTYVFVHRVKIDYYYQRTIVVVVFSFCIHSTYTQNDRTCFVPKVEKR